MADQLNHGTLADGALSDEQQMLLMALADGELDGEPELLAQAQALRAATPALSQAAAGQRAMSEALREAAFTPVELSRKQQDDMSMVRGRVMSQLPAPARAAVVAAAPERPSLLASIFGLSWGRLAFGLGAVAAAVALVVALRSPHQEQVGGPSGQQMTEREVTPGADATGGDEGADPGVIIEDMEIDSGTIFVAPAAEPDAPVIIWHLESNEEGAG